MVVAQLRERALEGGHEFVAGGGARGVRAPRLARTPPRVMTPLEVRVARVDRAPHRIEVLGLLLRGKRRRGERRRRYKGKSGERPRQLSR